MEISSKIKRAAALLLSGVLLGTGSAPAEVLPAAAATSMTVTFNMDKNINGGIPIKGVDISSVTACEQSGVVYRDENGEPQDIFKTLAENGVNYIRVRVWNHPYDTEGNSYGGGNCNTYNAGLIGARAAQYGMKLLVDLQYSDFWADPEKQTEPKDWSGFSVDWKKDAIYNFTVDALTEIRDAGADIGMVQIGNETNCFFCGVTDMDDIAELFKCGIAGVKAVDSNILTAVHFANPSLTTYYEWYAQKLNEHNVDYDVFATSYYSYWHGDTANLTYILKKIADTYNKYVMVAETAYPYTSEDFDHFGNAVSSASDANIMRYDVSVDGQEEAVLSAFQAVADVGSKGIGLFYWEPAWIGVSGNDYYANYDNWQKYGSGWATETAMDYDSSVAKAGGSSYDNQAMFDSNGVPLSSLSLFNKVYPESTNYTPEPVTTTTTTTTATTTSTTTATTTTSTSTTTTTEPIPVVRYPVGDVNHDDRVNIYDLTLMRKYAVDMNDDSDFLTEADINSDGRIDERDLNILSSYILGEADQLDFERQRRNKPHFQFDR